jgi:hypothetical protein
MPRRPKPEDAARNITVSFLAAGNRVVSVSTCFATVPSRLSMVHCI